MACKEYCWLALTPDGNANAKEKKHIYKH